MKFGRSDSRAHCQPLAAHGENVESGTTDHAVLNACARALHRPDRPGRIDEDGTARRVIASSFGANHDCEVCSVSGAVRVTMSLFLKNGREGRRGPAASNDIGRKHSHSQGFRAPSHGLAELTEIR